VARAVSTVLDVAVCLLFVGAAVATLAGAPQAADHAGGPDADASARTVATATTAVPAGADRLAHDTLAGHLGDGAVVGACLDGDRAVTTDYPEAVANETANLTSDRVFVTARWEPYPGAPLNGTVVAGREPPPDATVAARTLTVDSGVAVPARPDTFDALASDLAAAFVTRLFPPERTYARLVDGRTARSTVARYRHVAAATDADADVVTAAAADGDVHAANEVLADALAPRLAADLRERYPTPAAATDDLTVGEADVVVRRWEP